MKRTTMMYYAVLLGILAVGVGGFFAVSPTTSAQLLVGMLTSVAYVGWGMLYHAYHGGLHRKVVVEYILIGAIAIVVLLTLFGP